MKKYLLCFVSLFTICLNAQPDTEVYLFKIINASENIQLEKVGNISNNTGYDNQPYFYNDNIIVFSSTRGDQTDIAKYNIRDGKTSWLNNTPNGSEYSPIKIPGKKDVSAIKLDKDGTQLLNSYNFETGENKILVDSLKIGYHNWYNDHILICSVLIEDGMDLMLYDTKNKSLKLLDKNVGRSIHKIPNTPLISYISKKEEIGQIRSINPLTGDSSKIISMISNAEDICWLINGIILMPSKNKIYSFNPTRDKNWNLFKTFNDNNLHSITRIASNETGTLLSLVSEVSPEGIVQQQLDAYNKRDIETFLNTFSDKVEVYNFPNQLSFKGIENMRKNYADFFKNTADLHCKIENRIVIGNKVIDEELVTVNGNTINVVAIYEVNNGKISKVTFIK